MTGQSTDRCFNCRRDESQMPLLAWRYQGRERWVCSECLPLLIHKREQVLEALDGGRPAGSDIQVE